MRRVRGVSILLALAAAGCGSSDDDQVGTIVDKITVSLDKEAKTVTLHRGSKEVELEFPATTQERRGQVEVQLVVDLPQRGAMLVDDLAVNIAPQALTFDPPAQLRQVAAPPPQGRQYVAVYAEPQSPTWAQRGPAQPVGAP